VEQHDYYQNLIKRLCKAHNLSPRKPRFIVVEDVVTINVKNHLKEGVDLDCFKILNLIYQTVGKQDYIALNKRLENGEV